MSTSVRNWVIGVPTLKSQAFLDGNMDEGTTDMSNEPAKRYPQIKLIIFFSLQRGVTLVSGSVRSLSLPMGFFFAYLNTLRNRCQMRSKYLAPWLKSFIFQIHQGNIPTMLPPILLKFKRLILKRIMTVPSQTTFVNKTTDFRHRWRIPLDLLYLPPPGWVNYSKS